MRDFRRDNRSDRGRSFGGNRGGDRPQLFKATCANCGRDCEVPFKPTGNKPVLCRDCFRNNNGSDNRNFDRRDNDRPNFERREQAQPQSNYKAELDALNAKVDKILEILNSAMEEAGDEEVEEGFGKEEAPVAVEEKVEEVVEEPKEKKAPKKKTASKK